MNNLIEGTNAIGLVHGGCSCNTNPNSAERANAVLEQALKAGTDVIDSGGSALAAVIAAIKVLEDDPLFNAGRGSVLTSQGLVRMDAGLVDGLTLKVGGIAGLSTVKNPILAALLVLEHSEESLFAGQGAEEFCHLFGDKVGLEFEDLKYFRTVQRLKALRQLQALEQQGHSVSGLTATDEPILPDSKIGTVGAVFRDRKGNLAAGTSSGGCMNKWEGRVGDPCIPGAGVLARNDTCAISATGIGARIIQYTTAYDIHAQILYGSVPLTTAANNAILALPESTGGVIAIDNAGAYTMPFNTSIMYRGVALEGGEILVGC